MTDFIRAQILKQLDQAPDKPVPLRPPLPPLREMAMPAEALMDQFCAKVEAQTGIVHHALDADGVREQLTQVFNELKLKRAVASCDHVVQTLDLPAWAQSAGIDLSFQKSYADRQAFKDTIFQEQTVGISGTDFGVAESGTLALSFDKSHARLVSVAPLTHIALLPKSRIMATYEQVMEAVYTNRGRPSQLVFITGPSMTADIQGQPFKGMHGPQKLIVILF